MNVLFSSLLIITVCVRVLNIPGKASLSQTTQNLDHMCQISWYFLIFLQPGIWQTDVNQVELSQGINHYVIWTSDISSYHIYLHEFTWITLLNLFRPFCSQFKSLQDTYKFMYMYQMYVQCIAHYILFMLTLLHLKCILLHMHYESVYIYMPVSNTGTLLYN